MRMIPVVSRMCAVLFPGPSYCFLMVQQITVDIEAEFPHSSSDFLLSKGVSIYVGVHTHVCIGCGVQKTAAPVTPRKATRSLLGLELTNSARLTSQRAQEFFYSTFPVRKLQVHVTTSSISTRVPGIKFRFMCTARRCQPSSPSPSPCLLRTPLLLGDYLRS